MRKVLANLIMWWFEFMSSVHDKIKKANFWMWKSFGVWTMKLYHKIKGDK